MANRSYSNSSVYESYKLCVRFPPKVHSLGIWKIKDPFTYAVPSLEVQMVVIFTLTHLLHYPLRRLGLPKLFSEIMAGILLGPTLPKAVREATKSLFPVDTQGVIATLSVFGFMLFIFLFGVKTDLGLLHTSGKKAYAVAVLGLLFPLILGGATSQVLIKTYIGETNPHCNSLRFVSATQALSPFPVVVLLLKDLNILNSELGRLASNSAIVSELMSATLTFITNSAKSYNKHQSILCFLDIGLTVCFALVVVYIFRPIVLWVIRETPEGRPVKDLYLFLIISVVLISGAFTHWVKQGAILGPFIVGLAIPDGLPLGSALSDKLDSFVSGLFLPLFMSFISLRANLRAINLSDPVQISVIVIIIVAFVAKVIGCIIPPWFCRVPFTDALALGLIMSAKGIVEMSIYSFFREERLFNESIFTLLVTSTAILTVVTPIVVNYLYDPSRKYVGYQKRSIMKSQDDYELRIIMCIHRPDNVPAYTNLLDISCPQKENPLIVYVLNLIELRGRASPLFVSHHLNQEAGSHLYSQDVIFAFSRLERVYYEAIYTQVFTAISPRKLMHEDICTLALDKKAALIVIPFHRKWAVDGSVESDDMALRALNMKILDMAPCSVGVFIDRGRLNKGQQTKTTLSQSTSLSCDKSVVVIFFGGSDDREALAYAKRMTRDDSVTLTVVHFVSPEDENLTEIERAERTLDSKALHDITHVDGGERVLYIEETVDDGAETALMVREMVTEFDLIIVGRNKNVEFIQTSGLEEWGDCSELGVIGDLLASSDFKLRASVLVVHQQNQNKH